MRKEQSFLEVLANQLLKDHSHEELPQVKYEFKSDLSHFIKSPKASNDPNKRLQAKNIYSRQQHIFPFLQNSSQATNHEDFHRSHAKAPRKSPKTPTKSPLELEKVNLSKLPSDSQIKISLLINLGLHLSCLTEISLSELKKGHRTLAKKYHPDWVSNPKGPFEMAEINEILDGLYYQIQKQAQFQLSQKSV